MYSQKKTAGFLVALIAAGLALIAFFAMPFVAFGPFSLSAQQIANLASQYSSYSSNTGIDGSNSVPGILLLWLAPVIAGLIILLCAFQFRSAATISGLRTVAGISIALAVAGLILYGGVYIYLNQYNSQFISVTSLLGSGFWLYIIGMIGAAVGGIIVLSSNHAQQVFPKTGTPDQPYPHNPTQYPPG